jgi:BirA family biotin operon repressor/biotin-[acetyl-CoA-carboxylase] ligase
MENSIRVNKDLTTLFTGRQSIALPETDSTNSFLSFILRQNTLPEGTVIRAEKQNAGRGQRGTSWESEAGKNLLLSFVFYPSFIAPKNVFLLNKTFSLAVYDFAVKWLDSNVTVKWPNDIYFQNKKLAGILIENNVTYNNIDQSIFGTGININQTEFPGNLTKAVSFANVKNRQFDLDELFFSLCEKIEARYIQLKNGEISKIDSDYHSALYGKDEINFFQTADYHFEGKIRGVKESGLLQIETKNGNIKEFDLKEIKLLIS